MKKNILINIFVLLSLLIGMIFVDYTISSQVNQIRVKRGELQTIRQKNNHAQNIQQEYSNIESKIPYINQLLPDNRNLPATLGAIESLAEKNNVTIKMDFSDRVADSKTPQTDNKGPKSISFTLEIVGQKENILNFYKNLATGPYFIEVDKYDLSAVDGLSGTMTLSLGVKLYVDPKFSL